MLVGYDEMVRLNFISMPLDQKAIDELKKIHLEETGEKLSNQEAWDMGLNLIKLLKALSRSPKNPDNLTDAATSPYD